MGKYFANQCKCNSNSKKCNKQYSAILYKAIQYKARHAECNGVVQYFANLCNKHNEIQIQNFATIMQYFANQCIQHKCKCNSTVGNTEQLQRRASRVLYKCCAGILYKFYIIFYTFYFIRCTNVVQEYIRREQEFDMVHCAIWCCTKCICCSIYLLLDNSRV